MKRRIVCEDEYAVEDWFMSDEEAAEVGEEYGISLYSTEDTINIARNAIKAELKKHKINADVDCIKVDIEEGTAVGDDIGYRITYRIRGKKTSNVIAYIHNYSSDISGCDGLGDYIDSVKGRQIYYAFGLYMNSIYYGILDSQFHSIGNSIAVVDRRYNLNLQVAILPLYPAYFKTMLDYSMFEDLETAQIEHTELLDGIAYIDTLTEIYTYNCDSGEYADHVVYSMPSKFDGWRARRDYVANPRSEDYDSTKDSSVDVQIKLVKVDHKGNLI